MNSSWMHRARRSGTSAHEGSLGGKLMPWWFSAFERKYVSLHHKRLSPVGIVDHPFVNATVIATRSCDEKILFSNAFVRMSESLDVELIEPEIQSLKQAAVTARSAKSFIGGSRTNRFGLLLLIAVPKDLAEIVMEMRQSTNHSAVQEGASTSRHVSWGSVYPYLEAFSVGYCQEGEPSTEALTRMFRDACRPPEEVIGSCHAVDLSPQLGRGLTDSARTTQP